VRRKRRNAYLAGKLDDAENRIFFVPEHLGREVLQPLAELVDCRDM
jgi:hypothetical protein